MALRDQNGTRIACVAEAPHQVAGRTEVLDLRIEEDVNDPVMRHVVVRKDLRDLLRLHELISELDTERADRNSRMLRIQFQRPVRCTPGAGKEQNTRKKPANANQPLHGTYYTKVPRNAFSATWTGDGSSDFDQFCD